jgi:hypothetical protein
MNSHGEFLLPFFGVFACLGVLHGGVLFKGQVISGLKLPAARCRRKDRSENSRGITAETQSAQSNKLFSMPGDTGIEKTCLSSSSKILCAA